jgi:hypothetical protein
MDIFILIIEVTLSIVAVFAVPILLINLIDWGVGKYREARYPEYFELYRKAMTDAFRVGTNYTKELKYLKFNMELYTEGYRDGECTREYFERKMGNLVVQYADLTDEYTEACKENKKLVDAVDAYAREHNLKWGRMYD